MASVKARADSVLLGIEKESLDKLLKTSSTAINAMFHSVLMRLRDTQSVLQQSEKMAESGILAGVLAIKLNRPAAAILRGEQQLRQALSQLLAAQSALEALKLTREQKGRADELNAAAMQR